MRLRYWTLTLVMLAMAQARAEEPRATSASDEARTVCFVQPTTGSHIKKRVCMTAKEYEARRKADQEAMTKLSRGPSAEKQRAGSLR
jgi:hypothetical protein